MLDRLFASVIDLHWDLYRLTHSHRLEHNSGTHQGPCTAWPSPPYRAPVRYLLAWEISATRFLEVGTGMGYTAALMAEAGGSDVQVDTIALDSTHTEIARAELERKGLSDRVHILQGDAREIVLGLKQPYDVVFADSGVDSDIMPHLNRLTRPGGVPPQVKGLLRVSLIELLTQFGDTQEEYSGAEASVIDSMRDHYRQTIKSALETASTQQGQT